MLGRAGGVTENQARENTQQTRASCLSPGGASRRDLPPPETTDLTDRPLAFSRPTPLMSAPLPAELKGAARVRFRPGAGSPCPPHGRKERARRRIPPPTARLWVPAPLSRVCPDCSQEGL